MKAVFRKLKPASGFAHFVHIGLNLLLPIILFVLVRIFPVWVALLLFILSKWRMFAVRPRHWPVHIRINAVDLMVGISTVLFMANSSSQAWQVVWAVLFGGWLVFLKPLTGTLGVAVQALVGQTAALMALYSRDTIPMLIVFVVMTWLICYLSARHFFVSFEEPYGSLYAHVWGYFGATLGWILGHFLLYYGTVSQPALIIFVLSLGLGSLYYLEHTDRLSVLLRRQFVFSMVMILVLVLALSKWRIPLY